MNPNMEKQSLINFKYHLINEKLEIDEKFRTTIELTKKYKIPKSSLYNIIWGKPNKKWENFKIERSNLQSYLIL
tara:strand:- start:1674 stop:1895 length:222 start_codon:yes stop_codon:yes gene_type:complete